MVYVCILQFIVVNKQSKYMNPRSQHKMNECNGEVRRRIRTRVEGIGGIGTYYCGPSHSQLYSGSTVYSAVRASYFVPRKEGKRGCMSRVVFLPQHPQSSGLWSWCLSMPGCVWLEEISLIPLCRGGRACRRVHTNDLAAAYPPKSAGGGE